MRVAIVHEWFSTYAGSEKVVEQLLGIFPDADLYALVDFLGENERGFIKSREVTTSFIQKIPFAKSTFRNYLPLMPIAIEQFDLSRYDLIISSSHAVAKGVITGPDQTHVCYIHSPIRYAWDMQEQYLRERGITRGIKSLFVRATLHYLRMWDVRTSTGVDHFVANSSYIARRVWKCYRRQSEVIYPPVNVNRFTLQVEKQDYYVTVSRLVEYKRVDLLIEAFNAMPNKKLVVIGDGPQMKRLKQMASDNVIFKGTVNDAELVTCVRGAKAFVYAGEEDFGINMVESQASGTPVIAFAKGGAAETVIGLADPNPTGVLYYSQTPTAIIEAVKTFEKNLSKISPYNCRNNALRFSEDIFKTKFSQLIKALHVDAHGH